MKKTVALIAAALLILLSLPMAAQAQAVLQGPITDASTDGMFLMLDETHGEVLVKYNADTVMDGLLIPRAGQYTAVTYAGVMTRSLPPQVTAERVACYLLDGAVLAYDAQTRALLILTLDMGQVLAHLPEDAAAFAPGDFVTVTYNGWMLRTFPGQVYAYAVDRHESVQGILTDIEDGYLMIGQGDQAVRVNIDANTRRYGPLYVGESVVIYYSGVQTLSLPPQLYGEVLLAFDANGG